MDGALTKALAAEIRVQERLYWVLAELVALSKDEFDTLMAAQANCCTEAAMSGDWASYYQWLSHRTGELEQLANEGEGDND